MKNIVKMGDLTNEEVFQLIHRGLEIKNGKHIESRDDLYVLVQNIVLRLLSININ